MKFLTNKKYKATIQAARDEGQRSILFPPNINGNTGNIGTCNNEYKDYGKQVEALYEMYYAEADYGNDITRAIIDIRTAIIVAEGITVNAKKQVTGKWINNWLKLNGLDSDRLISFVTHGELEGRQLIILTQTTDDLTGERYIKANQVLWNDTDYNIVEDDNDYDKIKRVFTKTGENNEKDYPIDKLVFVKLAGRPGCYDSTPPRSANIIPQLKNYDKALYDLRKANNLFGFPTPAFEAKDREDAADINANLKTLNWRPGMSFAGTATMYYPSPPNSFETISREMSLNAKVISATTGVLVHWMGWTDLMSNRATAEELEELSKNTTTTDRLIWARKIKEMILKAMTLSIDMEGQNIKYDDAFEIEIPYISLKYINLLSSIYLPLQQTDVISMADLRAKIPGIDPVITKEQILQEKKDNMELFTANMEMNMDNKNLDNQDNKDDNEDEDNEVIT